jgi:hypothetical protein
MAQLKFGGYMAKKGKGQTKTVLLPKLTACLGLL